jgi:hypothetical protein
MNTVSVVWDVGNKFKDLTFDDSINDPFSKRVPIYYEFEDDILAYVVAWQKQGRAPFECFGLISRAAEYEGDKAYDVELTPEIREETASIRRFFQNKIVIRALNDEHVSKWMNAVTELLASPTRIKDEYVKVIVTLPRFYKESKETEAIFKDHVSISPTGVHPGELNEVFEFVGTIKRESKNENEVRHYFKNSKNEILAAFLPSNSPSIPMWQYLLSKNKKIKIKVHTAIGRQPGHDFYFYKLGNFYELSDADS